MMSDETRVRRNRELRVFLFHAVTIVRPSGLSLRERKYWMPATEFRSHLALLRELHPEVGDLERAWVAIHPFSPANSEPFSPRIPFSVALTFDDGRESDIELAWPLLQEHGMTATFFVNTATLDKPGYLRRRDIHRMSAEGAHFGSHAHRHFDLTALEDRALAMELRVSKTMLEDQTGRPVHFLAAPYGRVNRKVIDAAMETGYWAVCTSAPWPASPGARSVNRLAIHAGTSAGTFRRLVRGNRMPYWVRRARAACLALPARLLLASGNRKATGAEAVS